MLSKSFTDLFIRKPVIALVVNIVILVVGVVSYTKLNTRQYPRSDSAVVTVTTVYVGASADTGARLHHHAAGAGHRQRRRHRLHRIDEQLPGVSTITVHLRLNYDTNAALAQITSKINQVRNQLPPEAEAPTISVADRRQPVRVAPT